MDPETNPSLVAAIRTGDAGKVREILSDGRYDISTCGWLSAFYNQIGIMQYFIAIGANIGAGTKSYIRAATLFGDLGMIRYLVALGADIQRDGQYCMRVANAYGNVEICQYLALIDSATFDSCASQRLSRWLSAARAAYFWWVPRCYALGRRAGRRMRRRNYAAYLRCRAG